MNEEILALLTGLVSVVLFAAMLGGALIGAWLLGRSRGRAELKAGDTGIATQGSQLARIEQLVSDLGVEVERIAESQRFTARALAERAEPPKLPSPEHRTPL
jgi:hypothetical protein